MIMVAIIIGFPAVPWLMVGAIWLVRQYRAIRDQLQFAGGMPRL
ncbi:MAG: hypothetical protein ACO1OX_07840 [Novosphingobium sp.]